MNRYVKRGWRPALGALTVGAIVFGFSLQGAPAGDSAELASTRAIESIGVASAASADTAPIVSTEEEYLPQRLAAPSQTAPQVRDLTTLEIGDAGQNEPFIRQGRVIDASPVASGGAAASRDSRGSLGLGAPCDCDEDCDAGLGDSCNLVQCIVRSLCTGDGTTLCASDEDCFAAGGICNPDLAVNVQRCDTVGLIDWACDLDGDYCTLDRCKDDGTGTEHSVCAAQFANGTSGAALSPCGKECNAGPNVGQDCGDAGDCPGLDGGGQPAACVLIAGGACDSAAEACYVGTPGDLTTAIGRCCDGTATCTGETTEAACADNWYRYRSPRQVLDVDCECPKYGSGVTPQGTDDGQIGLVRPSPLVCQIGSDVATQAGNAPIYCEDLDGNGIAENFCQKRCSGGDNATAVCQGDINCALLGTCGPVGGESCVPANGNAECVSDPGDTCVPANPGVCLDDTCGANTIEGACSGGFLNLGDDYSLANGDHLRLTQFRFRGGVANQGEQVVFEVWDSTNATLIEAFAFTPGLVGIHDWAIEYDCYPNCDAGNGEVALATPIIIPPTGILKVRSTRTIGTLAGSAFTWSQTTGVDIGTNDPSKSWQDDVEGDYGTNVYIFEFLGEKVNDPLGACCDDGLTCEDTYRWECGICSDPPNGDPIGTVLCSSTLLDCPQGGLTGSFCQTNRWFGPQSNIDFLFGGPDLQLCSGISPCDKGGCCQPGGVCSVETESDCTNLSGTFLGTATDCSPNCCPQPPTGSDCACETKVCRNNGDNSWSTQICDLDLDCATLGDFSCQVRCTPNGTAQLRHPYTCHDIFPSEILPQVLCDPDNPGAACDTGAGETCLQSYTTSFNVVKNDTIVPDFTVGDGEVCSVNTVADNVGWFELLNLVDRTPGDGTDDCFHVTVGLCCTDPLLTPIWPFINQFLNCPCTQSADIDGIAPDFDDAGNQLDGFGAASLARIPCEDGNYAATFTLPPGEYGYQINSATNCAGSTTVCEDDTDCPGTSCVLPNPEYTVHFSVESCDLAACCLGDTCIVTNKLDCETQGGAYLGEGDNPIVTCAVGAPCSLGSCCLNGNCLDDSLFDEAAECEGQGGVFVGGITDCGLQPCPACPIENPANCQQVQTIFGPVPLADRNTDNGQGGPTIGITRVLADDVIFNGTSVDSVCWRVGMYDNNINNCAQSAAVDNTWEIKIYEDNADGTLPGALLCSTSLSVLNKVEGTGQATGTWNYSGNLGTPCAVTPLLEKYWVEVSGIGDTGCGIRATWSRDQGNEHAAWEAIDVDDGRLGYLPSQVLNLDVGFCEDDGLTEPAPVLGVCCTCGGVECTDAMTQSDCLDDLRGVWRVGEVCLDGGCPAGTPANDDCTNATVVSGVPDDTSILIVSDNNICATDDGPDLLNTFQGGCRALIQAGAETMHDDVWYAYTAEACGRLKISSCNTADNDQMIAIYDGDAGCPLQTADEIACNDDGCTGSGGAGPSDIELDVSLGQNLLVRVGGWNDEVPGGFQGDPRGFFDLQWSYVSLCPTVASPNLAGPPHDIQKNRYISIDPLTPNPGLTQFDIQLTVTATEVAGAPTGGVFWAQQPDGNCISQVTSTQPATEPDWTGCSTAHLVGCAIIPTTTYDIVAITGGDASTPPLVANTQAKPGVKWWGDVVGSFDAVGQVWTAPQGVVNIDDAVAGIKTFQDINAVNATHVSVTDVQPHGDPATPFGTPNQIVNIADVFGIILGFQGNEFPGPQLGSCP